MPLFAAENLSGVVDIQNNSQEIPEDIRLYQNFPNPFNPMTTIRYYLRATSQVTLKVYNALDQDIRILVDQKRASGEKLVIWDGKNSAGVEASSGVYIYRLHAEDHEKQLKMVLYR